MTTLREAARKQGAFENQLKAIFGDALSGIRGVCTTWDSNGRVVYRIEVTRNASRQKVASIPGSFDNIGTQVIRDSLSASFD